MPCHGIFHMCRAWMIKCVRRQSGSRLPSMAVKDLLDCTWLTGHAGGRGRRRWVRGYRRTCRVTFRMPACSGRPTLARAPRRNRQVTLVDRRGEGRTRGADISVVRAFSRFGVCNGDVTLAPGWANAGRGHAHAQVQRLPCSEALLSLSSPPPTPPTHTAHSRAFSGSSLLAYGKPSPPKP